MFLLSHSQEAEGGVKWNWAWPSSLAGGATVVSSHNAVQHLPPTPAKCDDIKPCFSLLFHLLLVSSPSWLPSGGGTEGSWETWLDFRGRDHLGQSCLARVSWALNMDSTTFCVLEKKRISSIFHDLERVLHPHSYCSSLVFFHVLSHNPHMFYLLYKKQTAPMSTPNS